MAGNNSRTKVIACKKMERLRGERGTAEAGFKIVKWLET